MIQHDIEIKTKNGRQWVTGIFTRNLEDAKREAVRLMGGKVIGSQSFILRNNTWEAFKAKKGS